MKVGVTFVVFIMVSIMVPAIKDPLMKLGVCCYSYVIARMVLWSLILRNQEKRLQEIILKQIESQKGERRKSNKNDYIYVSQNAL